jgi:hypothetical protein
MRVTPSATAEPARDAPVLPTAPLIDPLSPLWEPRVDVAESVDPPLANEGVAENPPPRGIEGAAVVPAPTSVPLVVRGSIAVVAELEMPSPREKGSVIALEVRGSEKTRVSVVSEGEVELPPSKEVASPEPVPAVRLAQRSAKSEGFEAASGSA